MDAYATGIAISSVLTGFLLWVLQPFAFRFGLVDRPGGRKQHALPTPITGGIAIAAAVLVSLSIGSGSSSAHWAYGCGALLLLVVGLLDDAYDLRWTWRVLAQVAAGLIMVYWGGVHVEYVGYFFSDKPIVLGAWAVPFTVFATVGIINAINMCDGSDGLAGSLCLAAVVMIGAAALYAGNQPLFGDLLPIIAAILAFLGFNMRFPWQRRAKVFLGNAGSAFLGYTIAWVVFRLTQNVAHPVSPVLAPWLLAPPLIDCLVLIARRLKMGRSPFVADRDHLHHLLLEAGFSPNLIAVGVTFVSVAMGLAAALVLRTDTGSEGHLVVGFIAVAGGYYWLTARRPRALNWFARVNAWLRRTLGTAIKSPPSRGSIVEAKDGNAVHYLPEPAVNSDPYLGSVAARDQAAA